ncbi:ATP synthase subunit delta [Mycoplasmopsis maculosa]|uniref:ATP synthase subunit delta n=1 Tax=Mycoplasmopsis maculosa TaxID=114885 RepID=A0A449B3I1_9BACT|nr:ATP synthase F1 subunit delta [Mycoplasmopsis maculosa]VEU75152.1 ATP synthase subunit delta [Mycoplasmopsis maculosa]
MFTKAKADSYALALFELINENNEINDYYKFLVDFNNELIKKEKIHLFFSDSKIEKNKKDEIVDYLTNNFNNLDLKYFNSFLKILINQGNSYLLPRIIKLIINFFEEKLNITIAHVYSAFSIDNEKVEKIKLKLENDYKTKIIIETHIDKNIISGFKIVLKNNVIENNMESDLQKIKENLLNKGGLNG